MELIRVFDIALKKVLADEAEAMLDVIKSNQATVTKAEEKLNRIRMESEAMSDLRRELASYSLLWLRTENVGYELAVGRLVCGSMGTLRVWLERDIKASLHNGCKGGALTEEEATEMYEGAQLAISQMESCMARLLGMHFP